ncbi:MAG: hypothetical protein WAV58_08725, partial [Lactococcus raffinolactis]
IPPAIFFYYSTLFDSRFKTLQQNQKYIADFYSLSEKTVSNQISLMRKEQEYIKGNCFRLSGRVWVPAFDKFLNKQKDSCYK